MVDFVEMEAQLPIKHNVPQSSRFRIFLGEEEVSVEKHEDESGAWQQRVKLPITLATRAKLPRSQSSANEIENLLKVCQTFCFLEQKVQQACQTSQTCRLRNWESIKHKFQVFQAYRFQNWYQSNTPQDSCNRTSKHKSNLPNELRLERVLSDRYFFNMVVTQSAFIRV